MKPLALTLLVFTSLTAYTQAQTPAKEFVIMLSEDNVDIPGGESKEIEVKVLRSKSYLKSSAVLGLSSSLPDGIELTFSPDKGIFETSKVIIKASEAAASGRYSLIINATLNGRTKGSILKVTVPEKGIARDKKQ